MIGNHATLEIIAKRIAMSDPLLSTPRHRRRCRLDYSIRRSSTRCGGRLLPARRGVLATTEVPGRQSRSVAPATKARRSTVMRPLLPVLRGGMLPAVTI